MKVYVGMSGGVDSSLSAALLVEQGHDVTGVYMKNWTKDLPGMRCPWADDLADAKKVAVQLNIPFKVFDFQKEYKHFVVDYMISEYSAGRTPNPDIMCNQDVKFKLFLETAMSDGADMIATGHYARTDNLDLIRAANNDKDQTYFLYRISAEAIKKSLFPIGDFITKDDVRAAAMKRNLITARKKDSQGICFVGNVGIRDFLSEFVETEPGAIKEYETGKIVGEHDGAIFYTIGQRHGLDLGGGIPYYVVGKDMDSNEVYVSTNLNNDKFWADLIKIGNLHWIRKSPDIGRNYQMRVRHRSTLTDVIFESENLIRISRPERIVSPGQSVVVYDGEICLGGGIVS